MQQTEDADVVYYIHCMRTFLLKNVFVFAGLLPRRGWACIAIFLDRRSPGGPVPLLSRRGSALSRWASGTSAVPPGGGF